MVNEFNILFSAKEIHVIKANLNHLILQAEYSEGLKKVTVYLLASKSYSPSNSFIQLSTTTPSVKVIID